ncbi:hypothetical protein BD289DRAFT_421809 [Coniella lustricola]|uniref:Uncharacterized protein n=1 Tax=Coniella lustricola TaxID=2025994 RepID=A0A2T3AL69_9PEZI|nr:hypothetical protein BD289DRAFT_421809 [Coniella lustricola]
MNGEHMVNNVFLLRCTALNVLDRPETQEEERRSSMKLRSSIAWHLKAQSLFPFPQ